MVQRQLINADDSVLIIFRMTIHLFSGRSNPPSFSSLPQEKLLLNQSPIFPNILVDVGYIDLIAYAISFI